LDVQFGSSNQIAYYIAGIIVSLFELAGILKKKHKKYGLVQLLPVSLKHKKEKEHHEGLNI
jgi:hypothetical protein